MCKHDVLLDMSCNKLVFWPGHCQHVRALKNIPKVTKLQQTKQTLNPTVKNVSDNKERLPVTKTSEKATVNHSELLLYVLPEHKNVSKIAVAPKIVVSSKQIMKRKPTSVLTLPRKKL